MQHLLASVDYRALETRELVLPPIQDKHYERPPEAHQTYVVDHYA